MEITDKDAVAIRTSIESQLEAFQRDDAEAAFAFASEGIQEQFQTPENFMWMVKKSYPAVYRPRSVFFEKLTTVQGSVTQPVLLLAPDGTPRRALYLMEREVDGSWKINGCLIVSVETEII
jgi:Domain of unknown function (DUF4864)